MSYDTHALIIAIEMCIIVGLWGILDALETEEKDDDPL
jgi:hypothetical protein